MRQGLLLCFTVILASYFFRKLGPFAHLGMARPATYFQYFVSLIAAFTAGFTEEVFFRGLLLSQLSLVTRNLTTAFLLQAFLFAASHGGRQTVPEFLKHYFTGCLFAYSRIKRKSLWPAILGHIAVDVVAFTIQFLHARRV